MLNKPWEYYGFVYCLLFLYMLGLMQTSPNTTTHHGQRFGQAASCLQQSQRCSPSQMSPQSGVYASNLLLRTLQKHILNDHPCLHEGSCSLEGDQVLRTTTPLITYPSTHHIFLGQGWRARAALYVYMLAPRLLRVFPNLPGLAAQLRMFDLAAAGLPAVGLLSDSEVRHGAHASQGRCTMQAMADESGLRAHLYSCLLLCLQDKSFKLKLTAMF